MELDLGLNEDYIVSTYPTPYNWKLNKLGHIENDWDYYTLLWSSNKNDSYLQKEFGFCFKSIDMYVDKYINYLDEIYIEFQIELKKFKEQKYKKKINKIDDPIRQLNLLLVEDKKNQW